jgi:hypothetical protein
LHGFKVSKKPKALDELRRKEQDIPSRSEILRRLVARASGMKKKSR